MAKGKYEEWLTEDGLLLIAAWARDGLTLDQIASNMGIANSTLRVWRDTHSAISAALKKGKEVVDIQVENALIKRALGYEFTEVTVEETENGTKTKTVYKQMAPDVTAMIYWLKNRKRGIWRDKPIEETDTETLAKIKELLGGVPSAI